MASAPQGNELNSPGVGGFASQGYQGPLQNWPLQLQTEVKTQNHTDFPAG